MSAATDTRRPGRGAPVPRAADPGWRELRPLGRLFDLRRRERVAALVRRFEAAARRRPWREPSR